MEQRTQPSTGGDEIAAVEERLKLENQLKGGAGWFFWIAGLSLVNSAILLMGGEWSFIIGLGITQIIDTLARTITDGSGAELGVAAKGIAFGFDLCVAGVFVVFGWFARKRYGLSFIVGMIVYALDGLLFLLVMDLLSLGFHVFAFLCILSGYQAHRKLSAMEAADMRPVTSEPIVA